MKITRRMLLTAAAMLLALLGVSCMYSQRSQPSYQYLIGVSQANLREPWRLVLMRELKEEAAEHPEIRLVFTDATSDSGKQAEDIRRLMEYGVDLLIVSPADVEEITPLLSQIHQQIPVIMMDRVVEGYDYTLFIGPDNEYVGRQAGRAVQQLVGDGPCHVLELTGLEYSASEARSTGFAQQMKKTGATITQLPVDPTSKDAAEDAVLALGPEVCGADVIFAHNDYIALGASKALQTLGREDVSIVGIDGFSGSDGGLQLVREGVLDATISCPIGGREAIQYSLDILNQVSGVPKQIILPNYCITKENVDQYEASLSQQPKKIEGIIRVGYAQVGTESGWRLANNESIRKAARELDIDLTMIDADNDQQAQLEAVRQFIRDDMDVIAISPITGDGWDEVLQEAKEAGIPVLLSDRMINVEQDDLFRTFIGADFVEEGRRAARWMVQNVPAKDKPVKILEIQGSPGASPTVERKRGFEQILRENSGYSIVYSQNGEYTREGGREVVEQYLSNRSWDIDVIFSHNDDMALGAVQALEEAGIQPGRDVKIISIDGISEALDALHKGKINCVVECSPLLGPQLMKAVTDLMQGKELPLRFITDERVFTQDTPPEEMKNRAY